MGKLRTREHQIEDLGFNHIEKQILLAGFTMFRYPYNDYGIDGFVQIFESSGESSNNSIAFQLKSTDHIQHSEAKKAVVYDFSVADLKSWLERDKPFLVILYDAQLDKAYFTSLEKYFSIAENRKSLSEANKFLRVYLPYHHIFNPQSVIDLR
jgi:hypothetical protein